MRRGLAVWAVAAAALAAGGCTRRNQDFCCTTAEACERHGGDGTIVECVEGSDRPYCDNQTRTCIEPPGVPCDPEGECADPDTPVCFEGLCVECGVALDCPFSAPVCGDSDHQCKACTDSVECGTFDDRPYCDRGACVGCRDAEDCAAASPVCDPDDRMCRGCVTGSECASNVCDWVGGACVDESDVLYVSADGIGDTCTREDPCGSIQDAQAAAGSGRNWILMAPDSYQETVNIDGDLLRIVADGADLRPSTIDSPAFDVRGGADLRISGLHIHDADGNGDGPGDGVYCTNSGGASTLLLDRVLIDANDDQGVDANGCDLTITRSVISDNRRGGIDLDSVDFDVTNNFIVTNGSGSSVSAGVLIDKNPPTRGRLEHNTIVANINPGGNPSGVQCVLVGNAIGFRNNIIFGNQGSATQVDGDNCEHTFSVIGPNGAPGDGNIQTAPTFVSETDFHLAAGSSGIDSAAESDIAVDFDGQPRPGGSANDIGADELP